MKIKISIFLLAVMSIFANSIFVETASAEVSACAATGAGWHCKDISSNPKGNINMCKADLCPGGSNIKCCPSDVLAPMVVSEEECKDECISRSKDINAYDVCIQQLCGTVEIPGRNRNKKACEAYGGTGNGISCSIDVDAKTNGSSAASSSTGGQSLNSGTSATSGSGTISPESQNMATVFNNPLQFDTVEGFLSHFLTVLQRIIVMLSLVFIVIGAVMYIVSAGNSGMIEKAKTAITSSLIGLTLGIAAPSFLKEISNILGWTGATSPEVEAALTLTQISLKVLNFLLSMVGILAILMLIVGGVMYLSSAGDEDRIDSGKKITKNAIIGIIISFSAMVLVRQIAMFFAN